jgi:hypothetical protein
MAWAPPDFELAAIRNAARQGDQPAPRDVPEGNTPRPPRQREAATGGGVISNPKDLASTRLTPLRYGIPVQELFSCFGHSNFNKRLFAVFTGYIDESGDDKTKLFTLSCLVSDSTQWKLFEDAWLDCLKRKNVELRAAGRNEMSRYHASSCASCIDEFEGWTIDEQKEFTSILIGVFKQYGLAISAYTLSLDDLVAEFPEVEKNPVALAYVITFNEIMIYLAQKLLEMPAYREDRLAFIHDRCVLLPSNLDTQGLVF